jgi:ATP-dependent helicase/nuclease subunit A
VTLRMLDSQARAAAIDSSRSFIVRAPAGSGKTELLIQRYLRLLGEVDEPEEVVAITFTRKAAAEMRDRVLTAFAASPGDFSNTMPHRRLTMDLARRVLRRAHAFEWQLEAQPERLRIETLDALNASLAQRLPILCGGVGGATLQEETGDRYRVAAQRTLDRLSDESPLGRALQHLLANLDNDVSDLERMLGSLLEKREQWLSFLFADERSLEAEIADSLYHLIRRSLIRADSVLPHDLRAELAALAKHAAHHAGDQRLRESLAAWRALDALPSTDPEFASAWLGLSRILLTQAGQWRTRATRREGFGPDSAAERSRWMRVLDQLRERQVPTQPFADLGRLPPARLGESAWHAIRSIAIVLEHAVAELKVEFAESGTIDFTELSLAGLAALGQVDSPSDLLLALDHRIRHILVDEFQDTSKGQYRLLELLTAGWTRGDGRTLFLVGDPMQSIYRFRNADMSLFLKVWSKGIGSVECEPLSLAKNFRSSRAIVDWVNLAFKDDGEKLADGAESNPIFAPGTPTREESPHQYVRAHRVAADSLRAEQDQVLRILQSERAIDDDSTIGILVQSRGHLEWFRDRLRNAGFSVRAVEIDAPNGHQVVQDLIGLCRALTHFADRIAWLAVLRAPWCGIPWIDLEKLVAGESARTVWELIHDRERLERLSSSSRARLDWMRARLEDAFARRSQLEFSRWVGETWRALDGHALLAGEQERDLARRFFLELRNQSRDGDLDDPQRLESAFSQPQRQPDDQAVGSVDLMTIHRAKGLEFDVVIVLGLNRVMRPRARELLIFSDFVDERDRDRILLAPGLDEDDALASYLRRKDSSEDAAERRRLAYVATTRGRERLHLVWSGEPAGRGTLLHCLWPVLRPVQALPLEDQPDRGESQVWIPSLLRFADGFDVCPAPGPTAAAATRAEIEYAWVGQASVQIGTIVHRYLQRIAEDGLWAWNDERVAAYGARLRAELALLGVEPAELDAAAARVGEALRAVLADELATWILRDWPEAGSEVALSTIRDGRLKSMRLDRTFVDEKGTRWIVDYKTSRHEGGNLDAFLDSEVERYRPQLEAYADAMRALDARPIRLALYFPLLRRLREVESRVAGE